MRIGIFKNWTNPDLRRQTPKQKGVWEGIEFHLDNPDLEYDYVIVLNTVSQPVKVTCPPNKIWRMMQEPPEGGYVKMSNPVRTFNRIYTNDESRTDTCHYHHHGSLPWHVNKSYDDLKAQGPITKTKNLSWITSNKTARQGHKDRMRFLQDLQKSDLDFDLLGRGFEEIDDKWDGLAPYKYSIAIENHRNAYYWTEKISDCFLAWTMPLYYGCTNIQDYFPKEAFVHIDIKDPKVFDHMRDVINSDLYQKSVDAIAHARELVLDKYNLFAFIVSEIEKDNEPPMKKKNVKLNAELKPHPIKTILPLTQSLIRRVTK